MTKSICVKFGNRPRYFDIPLRLVNRRARSVVSDPLLPGHGSGKPTLVLDLDETLVYMKCAQLDCLMNCSCSFEECKFFLAKRPGVDSFLASVVQRFEVVLWTAAPQIYADAALDVLDPQGNIFSHRLYRQHLVGGKKDISRLGRDLRRVLVVDDSKFNFTGTSGLPNVISVKRYISNGSQEDDTTLQDLNQVLTVVAAPGYGDLREAIKALGVSLISETDASPWRPSWRTHKVHQPTNMTTFLRVETPVYVPPPTGTLEPMEPLEEEEASGGVFGITLNQQ